MCGIVGYVGPDQALPILIEGLRRLEYRGYDSAGVAVIDGDLSVVKRAGKLGELEAVLGDRGGVKASSPLTVWLGRGANMLASAIPAVLQRTRTFVPVAENQVVEIRSDSVRITDLDGVEAPIEPLEVEWDLAAAEKGGHEDFMLKEIYEQPSALRDALRGRFDTDGRLVLDEIRTPEGTLEAVDQVYVVACGTAFHAGLVAKYAI